MGGVPSAIVKIYHGMRGYRGRVKWRTAQGIPDKGLEMDQITTVW